MSAQPRNGKGDPYAGTALPGLNAHANAANELIQVIGSCGRRFFNHEGQTSRDGHRGHVSYFACDWQGRIYFIDGYTGARIYTNGQLRRWKGFSEGGTLQALVMALRDFIKSGRPIPAAHLGPWPEYLCGGDLWGYGADMVQVREAAQRLGIIKVVCS